VGGWILVSGLSLQDYGYPPNFQYNEYRQVTGISGTIISFSEPLANTYRSTWPEVDPTHGSSVDLAGPATIFALAPTFGGEQAYFGLHVTQSGETFMGGGKSMLLSGMEFDGLGPAPSMGKSIIISQTQIGSLNEVDKDIEFLQYDHDTAIRGKQILVQSSSITNLVIQDTVLTTLNGTAQNTTINNSTINKVYLGPVGYGHASSITVLNSTISTAILADHAIDSSSVTFSNGTFRIANSSAAGVWAWAVPGQEYFFADYDGSIHQVNDTGSITTFKVLDVRQDATYTYVDTDLGATLPAPTFNGQPLSQYIASANATPEHPLSVTNIQNDHLAITRASLPVDQATEVANSINSGTQTEFQYVSHLLSQVTNTTISAIAVEATMYGAAGTSAEVDLLVNQFLPPQAANAIQFGLNPLIYDSEALGLAFAFSNETGSTAFAIKFGPTNALLPNTIAGDAAFSLAAVNAVFGSAATANLSSVMSGWVASWKAFFTTNGIPGIHTASADQIDLAARASAWGDAVGVALDNDLGPLKGQTTNFLMDAAEGIAGYSMPLVGQPAHHPFQGEI
jgi:hypothetical protein